MGILLEGLFFSPTELLLILGVVLLLFGGKKIPEVMGGIGSGIKNFKQALKEDDQESKPANNSATPIPANTPENPKQDTASESPSNSAAGK